MSTMAVDTFGAADVFRLHTDCVPVRGAKRSAIYDLGRREVVTFPTPYLDVLSSIGGRYTPADLAADGAAEDEDAAKIAEFVRYLIAKELGAFSPDAVRFPAIAPGFESPGKIQNAIVDIDQRLHDFDRVFGQLDELDCEFVQVRAYSTLLGPEDVASMARAARHKTIRSLELLVGYRPEFDDATLERLVREHLIVVKWVVHGAPADHVLEIRFGSADVGGQPWTRKVTSIRSRITSSDRCGRIVPAAIQPPSVQLFHELLAFNGCLNGKISIDAEGEIKNCPSFGNSFGNIASHRLSDVMGNQDFRRLWQISKDQIDVCRDCEYRYACTDCRAYLARPGDLHSKPGKCAYDPYSATWRDSADHTTG
jgi:SPASM domain peptide maturase of grasp-with-spasm system